MNIDTSISSVNELREKLQMVQDTDDDALLCFDYGCLWNLDVKGGHVCVFHGLDGENVWLIDPERNVPKHREVSLAKLFEAVNFHGPENSCGVWTVNRIG